ncbi:glycoside hydrolase family 16 protein [Aplosporella prunicola CBS 121167]|uniref:Glycoside hydrolase family 16 protein n=1 Tax=Aplosporella prunicola CBS 121167 TaxID=1176127 RepID=A0A6A6BBU6_9PEZI|nr:glycoside hydrolase family 16 protein [Aplosporella prunicola CBS 121167]KAF2141712.1 glycoside hydrolase family 16 protein [Aplosporella prunicola CBS 121167]
MTIPRKSLSWLTVAISILLPLAAAAAAAPGCSCGFYDDTTGDLYTESLITYFNETSDLSDFVIEEFEHRSEKAWNGGWRQGAVVENVQSNYTIWNSNVTNGTTLGLFCDPSTKLHLVNGGSVRSRRRDIQYGTFRSLMRSPQEGTGGSSLSMRVQFNETESIEINAMNTQTYANAWVSTLMQNEWPDRKLGVNYTILGNSSIANGTAWPFDFMEFRFDWTDKEVRYYIGQNNSRTVTKKKHHAIPMTPAPLYFRHWSTGNTYSMEGPPYWRNVANIGWARMFFNSSEMTADAHDEFDSRCTVTDACSVNDMSLRETSEYTVAATKKFKHKTVSTGRRWAAIWISVISISFTSFLLLHAIIKKAPWKRFSQSHDQSSGISSPAPLYGSSEASVIESTSTTPFNQTRPSSPTKKSADASFRRSEWTPSASGASTPLPRYQSREYLPSTSRRFEEDAICPIPPPTLPSVNPDVTAYPASPPRNAVAYVDGQVIPEYALSDTARNSSRTLVPLPATPVSMMKEPWSPRDKENSLVKPKSREDPTIQETNEQPIKSTTNAVATETKKAPIEQRQRVDYLAGLVALCSIFVTLIHFHLTYIPAVVIPGSPVHYQSEVWARKIISPFIMNQMWLGVFFTTSTRFLSARYFREGNLIVIAERAVKRTPRLLIPVTAIVMLEYFFIDVGATKYLEYLPSVTWSTWAYVSKFPSPGHFISEILELIYLIPNAVPQITFNYCTGVLWTIAVQLQGSWLVLLGAVVVREIKTPWKRFGYYWFCVLNNWYARNWGSFFWLGLMLTDLDVTYKWRKWLYRRPLAYYPLMCFCAGMVGVGFTMNLLPNWISYNFTVEENGIHPDQETGQPIKNTPRFAYPNYYEPRFNMLLFAVGMQAIVELSTFVQKLLSFKLLVLVFPHIFTIYLIHGFVFWSWGSWLCIFLAHRAMAYWAMMLIVGLTSYAIIFLSLPIITPIIEILGRDITLQVWKFASEKPAPKRATLFPYNKYELGMVEAKSDVHTHRKEEEHAHKHEEGHREHDEKGSLPLEA